MRSDWLKNSRHFINQAEDEGKPILSCSHSFSRAWRTLHVFASSSDWFNVVFASALIGKRIKLLSIGFGLNRPFPSCLVPLFQSES